jgi:hypothetical protein
MATSFVIYVDESGCDGFRFDCGSSEWFVLSAAITHKSHDSEVVTLLQRVRVQLHKPPAFVFHFRDMSHQQRLPFVAGIAGANLRTVTVFVHKPSIKEQEIFRAKHRLYFYGMRYLLERASWYCRDHRQSADTGDGSADLIISNRAGVSYDELKDYFNHLRDKSGMLGVRIDWGVIKQDQITAIQHSKRAGLQVADAVASAHSCAVEFKHGFTEDRYARMLKPRVYTRNGSPIGYGLKFWPRDVDEATKTEGRFGWVREW